MCIYGPMIVTNITGCDKHDPIIGIQRKQEKMRTFISKEIYLNAHHTQTYKPHPFHFNYDPILLHFPNFHNMHDFRDSMYPNHVVCVDMVIFYVNLHVYFRKEKRTRQ